MKNHRIAIIAGDGIGQEVMPEGLRVLQAAARKHGIGLEFEDPVAIVPGLAQKRCGRLADHVLDARRVQGRNLIHDCYRSIPLSPKHQGGRLLAGPHGALDRGGQAGVGPVARQDEVGPGGPCSRAPGFSPM